LQLRGVPSSQRVHALETEFSKGVVAETTDEDGWVSAATGDASEGVDLGATASATKAAASAPADDDGFDDLDADDGPGAASSAQAAPGAGGDDPEDDDDEFVDLDSFGGDDLDTDAATAVSAPAASAAPASAASGRHADDGFERRRSYDISIVYDRKYRVPRMFLFGYDEVGV
jgi:hypothetical protein